MPEFGVIYLTETHAVFESDETGVVEFDGPTMLFLFPGVWHRYRPVAGGKGWMTARWFNFNGDIGYRLMKRQFVTPETAVRPAARPRRLAAAVDRFVDQVGANPARDSILLSMHAMDLLAICLESAHDGSESMEGDAGLDGGDKLVGRVLDLVWTGSHRSLSMEQLCRSVGANRRTVERRFRAARGHSLLTEVNLCRCRRARHFLDATELPITNVCSLAGFANLGQMRLTFLHYEGVTPSQYRRSRSLPSAK